MLLSDTLITAYRGVTANVSRALLTMLGIIIGVGSVVLMSAIGASMQGVILGQISSLGAKSMVIFPGQMEGGPNSVGAGHDSLTFDDVEALRKLRTIENVAPVIFVTGTSSYGNSESSPQVFGVTEDFFLNQTISATEGRLLDASDVEGGKAVAVLAPDAKEKLFGSVDPLGKRLKIGSLHYTVVGVSKALGSQFFQNADDRIYVPFTVARTVSGQKFVNYITMLATENFDIAFDDVKSLLRQRHSIENPEDDPKDDDFIVRSSAQANDILGSVSLGLTLFITTIAAISLLVGGIGIMNIMLVSVTERTREIGLRKAIGARPKDILFQFLIESVLLTVIGGMIGMAFGIGIAFLAAVGISGLLSTYHFAVSMPSILASLLMAAITGLVFGISPARRASRLHPIDALRYE
ncbi:MAG: ABC transporter permease [Candidatus Peregrinibacteria bacterium]|nr:ABC transporter permease [Candidatus Peregrinibacteria bacterium]